MCLFYVCLLSIYLSVVSFYVCLCIYLSVCRVSEEECDEDFLPSPMSRYRQLLFASLKFCLAILTSLGIENQDCGNQVSRLRCKMLGAKTGEQTRVSDSWHENLKLRTESSHIFFIYNILIFFSLKFLISCFFVRMFTHDEDFIYFKNNCKSFINVNFK